jgi:amphiphysin
MADTKGANISKMMLKQAGRAKEKLMQNLGKADKTTDEIFEEHLNNFNSQQVNSTRLHKDINNYLRCIRAMQTASKNLMETLHDIYEKDWVGQDMLYMQAQNTEMLWADLAHKLSDQVVIPLNTYQGQFPEMRKKIDKRGRKLIDFDAERHAVQTMQNNPNRNEGKYVKVKEQMENAKRTYELLNSELHDELPALYDSRILFLVTNLQTLFSAEEVFHSEMSKVFSDLEGTVDKLAKEVQKGTLPRKVLPKPAPLGPVINNAPVITNSAPLNSLNSPPKGEWSSSEDARTHGFDSNQNATNGNQARRLSPGKEYEPIGDHHVSSTANGNPRLTEGRPELYDIPVGATTDNLPPGVLYKVKASYKYQAEDTDELQFEVGEVIDVVEYDDPEEQEEGWLMGIKNSSGQKGMFPANFTRPI